MWDLQLVEATNINPFTKLTSFARPGAVALVEDTCVCLARCGVDTDSGNDIAKVNGRYLRGTELRHHKRTRQKKPPDLNTFIKTEIIEPNRNQTLREIQKMFGDFYHFGGMLANGHLPGMKVSPVDMLTLYLRWTMLCAGGGGGIVPASKIWMVDDVFEVLKF